jgi:predicted DCC family thiol-disulfide oxidoreductase YuxK
LNRFVIRRDQRGKFLYAPLQSQFARQVLSGYDKDPSDLDTLYVVVHPHTGSEVLLARADAVFFILNEIGGGWRFAAWLGILPKIVLNFGYGLVARNRYRAFGKYDACLMPEPEERAKFIEVGSAQSEEGPIAKAESG